jgi:hypothetical protein
MDAGGMIKELDNALIVTWSKSKMRKTKNSKKADRQSQ